MTNPKYEWSCGHTATAQCAECHRLLTLKANIMVEIIDDLLEEVGGNAAAKARKRLTAALHDPTSTEANKRIANDT